MSPKPKRRQTLELAVKKVAFGGKGIAHHEDFVVFVDNTLPGDRVMARISKVRKNYAQAYVTELLEPSTLRQPAKCEHFGHCGGCKWQNVDYQEQLRFKKQHVAESLKHIGGLTVGDIRDVIPSPLIFGYRNKMEFSFTDSRWLTPEDLADPQIPKGPGLGLHVPGFFDKILDINHCWLQPQVMNDILTFSRRYFKESGLSIYNNRQHAGLLRFLVLRYSFADERVLVNVVSSAPIIEQLRLYAEALRGEIPQVASVINAVNSRRAQIAQGEAHHLIYGEPVIYEQLQDFRFEISPDAFFQTNTRQAERLYQVVEEFTEPSGKVIWDLYSGAGSIAIFLAGSAKSVAGFEIVENAVQDADKNAKMNNISNARFIAGDLRETLPGYTDQPPDVLICDPPRAGMHKDVLAEILRLGPPRIVYVSCNPATMARDIEVLQADYDTTRVQPVDMFPHTYHIESVAELVKK